MTLPISDPPLPLPPPGTILNLPPEAVYLSNEAIRLRVRSVADGKPVHPATEWVSIDGQALKPDGTDRGYRSVLVDVRALRRLMAADNAEAWSSRAAWPTTGDGRPVGDTERNRLPPQLVDVAKT